jgi:hypothetical protein
VKFLAVLISASAKIFVAVRGSVALLVERLLRKAGGSIPSRPPKTLIKQHFPGVDSDDTWFQFKIGLSRFDDVAVRSRPTLPSISLEKTPPTAATREIRRV